MLNDLRLRLRSFFHRDSVGSELSDELRFHFDQQVQKLTASGVPLDEARRRARLAIGTRDQIHEEFRDATGVRFVESLLQDIRFALRMLRKSPGFTAVAVLTLALGIGANTAIFSVVDAILLKPLPYPDANRLAIVLSSFGNEHRAPSSGYAFEQMRQHSRLFKQIGGIWVTNATIVGTSDPQPEGIKLAEVTADFLPLICNRPALGRFFVQQDAAQRSSLSIVISYGLWRRKFDADRSIIGKPLHIGDNSLTILGVLPQDFRLIFPDDASVPETPDVYILLSGSKFTPGGPAFLHLVGRLRSGATIAQAQSELDVIAGQLRATVKSYNAQNYSLQVIPFQQDDVRNVRSVLVILFGGVGFVLLIACANVANLLLARAGSRQRETTVRAALGASRGRLVRQLLTESIMLAFFGGMAAVFVGWAALQGLLALRPQSLLHLGTIRLDAVALAFTFIVALLTGIVFGVAPALATTRLDLTTGLKSTGDGRFSPKQGSKVALILCEVAVSFALLTGTGLLVRTFVSVLHVDPGFQPANVLSFTTLGGDYPFLHQLQQNLSAFSGVQSVSVVSHVPLDNGGPGNWYEYYWPEGASSEQQNTAMADYRSILPGYFKTIGATMIEGRDFTDTDDASHQHVIIVDDALAKSAWPGQDALGKRLHISDSPAGWYKFQDDWGVVVGVVHHVQYHSLTVMVRPQVYEPYQLAPRPVSFVLRASAPLPSLIAPIRGQISKLNKTVAVTRFIPLSELVAEARSQTRFITFLSGALAGLALLLTCIGIYGVTSYLVKSRTSEIGIRMALGASPRDVRRLVLRSGMAPVVFGCLIGIALSLPLTPLLAALLFGVRPMDAPTFAATALFLCGVGFFSCYIPARRAMKVDPLVALRYE
ncbi:MAG TPA: ABC transporter permease [Candidatus Acidoferrales bacterium]|nr:ABC transporter permease [Candidatus Acidoferrales bacterium]